MEGARARKRAFQRLFNSEGKITKCIDLHTANVRDFVRLDTSKFSYIALFEGQNTKGCKEVVLWDDNYEEHVVGLSAEAKQLMAKKPFDFYFARMNNQVERINMYKFNKKTKEFGILHGFDLSQFS